MYRTQLCRAASWALLLGSACSAPAPIASTDPWIYVVALRDGGEVLDLRLTLPAGPSLRLGVAPAAVPFVRDVTIGTAAGSERLTPIDDSFAVPAAEGSRELQWRFLARSASAQIDKVELASWQGDAFAGSLGAFLLNSQTDTPGQFILRIEGDADDFACATPTTPNGWTGELRDLPMLPSCAFGRLTRRTIAVDAAHTIDVIDLGPRTSSSTGAIDDWVRDAATAVRDYCGAFPVTHLLLLVAPGRGATIAGGSARGLGGGARIFVDVPPDFDADDLRRDWVLFHEMLHLALPSLAPAYHWLEEGSATYIEPLLQVRAGRLTETEVWRAMLNDFDQGLPAPDAGGLDDDHSWGRTYYGGAIFCLRADVEIRRRTDNRRSLQDAMAAIVAAGGNITAQWPIEDVLRIADQATGTTVLSELFATMRSTPEPRELQSLWRELGVRLVRRRMVFDDDAPLAGVRRSLLSGVEASRGR